MTGEARYIHGLRGVPDGATVVHHAADGSIVATVELQCDGMLPEPVMLLRGEGVSVRLDDGVLFVRNGRPLTPQSTPAVPVPRTVWRDVAPFVVACGSIGAEVAHLTAAWPWWAFVLDGLVGGVVGRYAAKRELRRAKRRRAGR